MHRMFKVVLTAAVIVGIAWPLVFWSKAEAPRYDYLQQTEPRAPLPPKPWHDAVELAGLESRP